MLGIDRAAPLTPSDIAAVQGAGIDVRFACAYLGGPTAAAAWSASEVQALAGCVDGILPIYVGRNAPWRDEYEFSKEVGQVDALEAEYLLEAWQLEALGVQPIICLDVEYQTFEAFPEACLDYVAGFCDELRSRGILAMVYGSPATIEAVRTAGIECLAWVASWQVSGSVWLRLWSHEGPVLDSLTRGLTAPADVWQFVAEVPLIGGIDLNTASEDIPLMGLTLKDVESRLVEVEARLAALEGNAPAEVQIPAAPVAEPGMYIVRPGDTLSGIAGKLGHLGEWPLLAAVNPQVADPGMIYPGQQLTLPEDW